MILVTVPIFSYGQYALLLKRQQSPYDSAIAVQITRYRLESLRFKYCDSLVNSLKNNIFIANKEIELLNKTLYFSNQQNKILFESSARKDKINQQLQKNFDLLSKELNRKKKFYNDPKLWSVATFIFTIIILK